MNGLAPLKISGCADSPSSSDEKLSKLRKFRSIGRKNWAEILVLRKQKKWFVGWLPFGMSCWDGFLHSYIILFGGHASFPAEGPCNDRAVGTHLGDDVDEGLDAQLPNLRELGAETIGLRKEENDGGVTVTE